MLPLSARSLWLTHVSSVLLAGALVSLGPALVTAAHAHIRNPGDAVHLGVGPLGILLRLLAGLILAVALLEAHRPTLVRPPAAGREAVRVALVLLGTPMAIVLLPNRRARRVDCARPRRAPGPCHLPGHPRGLRRGTADPKPAAPRRSPVPARAGEIRPTGRTGWRLVPLFLRLMSAGPKEFLAVPLIALVGFGLGGGLGSWNVDLDLFDARYTWPTWFSTSWW